jgi:hypothetical protein
MMKYTLPDTIEDFEKWLNEMPPNIEVVGFASSTVRCPIAQYLKDKYFPLTYDVDDSTIIQYGTEGKEQFDTSEWMAHIIHDIDLDDGAAIDVKRAQLSTKYAREMMK